MRLLEAVYIAVTLYIFALSFMPLAADAVQGNSWVRFGWGGYSYESTRVSVRLSEVYQGGSKPLLYLYSFMRVRIPFVEVSDYDSYVDGMSLQYNRTGYLNKAPGDRICQDYYFDGLNLTKSIEVSGNQVQITYNSSRKAVLAISIHYHNESLTGITTSASGDPSGSRTLTASFKLASGQGNGSGEVEVLADQAVPNAEIVMDKGGEEKLVIIAETARLTLTIDGELTETFIPVLAAPDPDFVLKRLLPVLVLLISVVGWRRWVE